MTPTTAVTLLVVGVLLVAARPVRSARRLGPNRRRTLDSDRPRAAVERHVDAIGAAAIGYSPWSLPMSATRAGWTIVVAGVLLPFAVWLAVAWTIVAVSLGWMSARRRERSWRLDVVEECATLATLLTIAVSCGHTPRRSVEELGAVCRGPLAAPTRRLASSLTAGLPFVECLDEWGRSVGSPCDDLATVLSMAHREGGSSCRALGDLAASLRSQHRRAAEERARRLPVSLLAPLVLCILPAFVLLTVVPMIASGLQRLSFPS